MFINYTGFLGFTETRASSEKLKYPVYSGVHRPPFTGVRSLHKFFFVFTWLYFHLNGSELEIHNTVEVMKKAQRENSTEFRCMTSPDTEIPTWQEKNIIFHPIYSNVVSNIVTLDFLCETR